MGRVHSLILHTDTYITSLIVSWKQFVGLKRGSVEASSPSNVKALKPLEAWKPVEALKAVEALKHSSVSAGKLKS